MHATITDWETEMPATPESFVEAVGDYFEEFRKVGATNLRVVETGDNRVCTITLWPDEETANFAIEAIETLASSVQGVKFITAEKGPLLAEFD